MFLRVLSLPIILISATCVFSGETEDYDKADKWALAATEKDEASIAVLSKYLAKGGNSEKEKARVIYRWITDCIAYDAEGLFSGKFGDQSSKTVLKKRSAVCAGYANLFYDLAAGAGVEAVKIDGFAKGAGYKLGQKTTTANHSWNAIQIDKKWFLLDST